MTERLDYRAIGSRVRELRLQHKMTQEYLAELVDISPSFIGHIERGEKKPSLETMSRLTRVLGTTMDYLVLGVKNRCNQQECQLYVDLKHMLDRYGESIKLLR